MHNTITLRPGSAPLVAPTPPCVPGRVLVRRVHAFVPATFFRSAGPSTGWIGRLRRRYPRSLRKAIEYVRTEGVRQTWTKLRSRVALERFDTSYGAFAAVGVVVQDARGCLPPGSAVMCWSWHGPVDADFHLVAPEQCLRVPDLRASYALAPFVGWIASLLKSIQGGVGSCEVVGIDPRLVAPLTAIVGSERTAGRRVVVGCGSARSPKADGVVAIRLSAGRVITPLMEAEAHGFVARLPDPAHYFLDPYYPETLELPGPFAREAVEEALAVLVQQAAREAPTAAAQRESRPVPMLMLARRSKANRSVSVSCLGAGNYVRAVLLHHLRRHIPVRIRGVMDIRPDVAARQASALGAEFCATDAAAVLEDAETDIVLIASDHASHAGYAAAALRAGKAVHLEKPPAVTRDDLDELVQALQASPTPVFHLGYNRPYAPAVIELQRQLDALSGPTFTTCTVHGYFLSRAHWYRWPNQGTRIAGNLVHWIDLGYRLSGRRRPAWVEVSADDSLSAARESVALIVGFDDGGTTTVRFSAGGDETFGIREKIEVRKHDLRATIDDFQSLTVEHGARRWRRRYGHDKGHSGNLAALAALIARPSWNPQTIRDLESVGAVQFAAQAALLGGGGRTMLS